MDNEVKYDDLSDISFDISSLQGMSPEKLEMLNSLGVMTNESYNEKVQPESEDEVVQEKLKEMETEVIDVKIDLDVDKPNIILPKAEIVRALRYATVMIKKVTSDIEASGLNITYKDGKVLYRLKDNMTWLTLDGSCKVSNDKPITKTLTFKTAYLTKLLTAATNDVLIYEGTATGPDGTEKQVYYAR